MHPDRAADVPVHCWGSSNSHGIMEGIGLEGTLKAMCSNPPCNKRGEAQLYQELRARPGTGHSPTRATASPPLK